jgi:glucose-fructose oxidoreductase
MVNWPNLRALAFETGQALINEGAIGRPHQFTFRGGNSIATRKEDQPDWFQWIFEANEGGGSWIDYAGYGASPCVMWMGTPKRMIARGSTMLDPDARADETATAILEFDTGIGYMQTSHIQVGYAGPQGRMMHIEVNGDEGTLVLTPAQTDSDHSDLMIYDNKERFDGSPISLEPRSPHHQSGAAYMAHAIRTGQPIEGRASFRFNREVVSVIDAGSRAIASGDWIAVAPSMKD